MDSDLPSLTTSLSTRLDVDLCVIGCGEAGFAAVLAGVALGVSVAVVTRRQDDRPAPRPAFLLESLRHEATRAAETRSQDASDDFLAVTRRVKARIAAAAPDRRFARLSAMNVHIVRGGATFTGPRTLMVDGTTLSARRFLLATGRDRPAMPPVLDGPGLITLPGLLDCPRPPEHLLILGGGAADVALAQCCRDLGIAVTVVAPSGIMPGLDPELVMPVVSRARAAGIVFREDLADTDLRHGADGLTHAAEGHAALAASHVLIGERPGSVPRSLGLDRAGVTTGNSGLTLSAQLQTSNPRIYAVGALAGAKSAQAAQAQVGVVMKAAFFRLPTRYRADAIPCCTATSPPMAWVGTDEQSAAQDGPVEVWRWPFAETDAGQARGDTIGHVKVITDRRGRVVGAGIVGSQAAEQIGFWSLAVATRTTLQALAAVSLPSPALAEASRRIIVSHTAKQVQSRWVKRALALMKIVD